MLVRKQKNSMAETKIFNIETYFEIGKEKCVFKGNSSSLCTKYAGNSSSLSNAVLYVRKSKIAAKIVEE